MEYFFFSTLGTLKVRRELITHRYYIDQTIIVLWFLVSQAIFSLCVLQHKSGYASVSLIILYLITLRLFLVFSGYTLGGHT